MGDVMWELTLCMKDASSGEKVVTRTMKRCDICYYNIVNLIEEYGYMAMDYIYIKRYVHGQSGMVELLPESDILRMLHEHEADRKLSLYVTKYSPSFNIRADRGDSERNNYRETSHQNDHKVERVEINAELDAMKRRRADHGAILKTSRRLQDMRHESEDEDYVPQNDGNTELTETEEEDEENIEDELELPKNEEQDENLQDSLDLTDTILPDIAPNPIKLIWPSGLVREVMGRFQVSNLMNMKDAKVIVETDKNGVPNQRSGGLLGSFLGDLAKKSSYAPLNIARWDNKLLRRPKESLIEYVKTKFVYPEQTADRTRHWILKVVNKRWRAYKSFLRNKYYNPKERSLEEIKKYVPPGVNEHQWIGLLGIWCQEQHLKTCMRNSESAKQQKHPHTTGRKSHPRLRKEMEDKMKQPVSKIDLCDEAHKKKNGSYANKNVQKLMDKAHFKLKLLKKRKTGNLSARDLDQVFDDVIAKKLTVGGYYDETYWGNARAYEGSTSGEKSAREARLEEELASMKSNLNFYTELSQRMCALMAKKFPDENISLQNNGVITANDDNTPTTVSTGVTSYKVDNIEKSMDNIASSKNDPKVEDSAYGTMTKGHHANSSSPHQEQIMKVSKEKELPKQQALQQINSAERANGFTVYKVENVVESHDNVQAELNCTKHAHVAHAKDKGQRVKSSSAHNHIFDEASKTKELMKDHASQKKHGTIFLLSMNSRNRRMAVAKGIVHSTDNAYMVGGDMLGSAFYGIMVQEVSHLGSERLPQPYGNFQTVEDAVGHCIAWSRTHVKKLKRKLSQLPLSQFDDPIESMKGKTRTVT